MAAPSGLRQVSGSSKGLVFIFKSKRKKGKLMSRSWGLLPKHAWVIVSDGRTAFTAFRDVMMICNAHSYLLNWICHFYSFLALFVSDISTLQYFDMSLAMEHKQPIFKVWWYPTQPRNWFPCRIRHIFFFFLFQGHLLMPFKWIKFVSMQDVRSTRG